MRAPRRPATAVALLATALLAAFAGTGPAAAQRTLEWRALEVTARLDADGRLHVVERHAMVFDGDWNGGERTFRVGFGQHLRLESLVRETPQGDRHLEEGSLDEVDRYGWGDGDVLRWRSRLPSDPPFAGQELVYRIAYTLSGVLERRGEDGYLLDHDFAFPDREWPVERFTLDLEIDSAWRPLSRRPDFAPRALPPAEGFVVTLPLAYVGAGRPAAVATPAPAAWRAALAALLFATIAIQVARLVAHERRRGRIGGVEVEVPGVEAPGGVDRAWLEEHVLALAPEVAGAAWDERTSAPEVAALLARMELEGKLASRVEGKAGLFQSPELRLELLVPEGDLPGDERRLVKALFFGATETSTARVRERYAKRGFAPASKLTGTRRAAERLGRRGGEAPKPSRWPAALAALAGVACLALDLPLRPSWLVAVVPTVAIGALLYGLAASGAVAWRRRVHGLLAASLFFAAPLGLLVAATLALLAGRPAFGVWIPTGLTLLAVAATTSVLHLARSRQPMERILLRRRLAAARELFRRELRRPSPALEDAWLPWLLALGLGRDIDRWSVAAASGLRDAGSVDFVPRSGSVTAAVSGGGAFTGGGGRFGGAGATSSWALAASGLAAGVPAPSSGGSGSGGGGGGGGSSSGGGGGGGW